MPSYVQRKGLISKLEYRALLKGFSLEMAFFWCVAVVGAPWLSIALVPVSSMICNLESVEWSTTGIWLLGQTQWAILFLGCEVMSNAFWKIFLHAPGRLGFVVPQNLQNFQGMRVDRRFRKYLTWRNLAEARCMFSTHWLWGWYGFQLPFRHRSQWRGPHVQLHRPWFRLDSNTQVLQGRIELTLQITLQTV